MAHTLLQSEFDADLAVNLGVSEAEAGYACVRVAPEPTKFIAISGALQLPIGTVSVSWRAYAGVFKLEVDVPVGVHLQVRLPATKADALYVDGEPIPEDTQTVRTDNFVELAVLPGNRYNFEVRSGLQNDELDRVCRSSSPI